VAAPPPTSTGPWGPPASVAPGEGYDGGWTAAPTVSTAAPIAPVTSQEEQEGLISTGVPLVISTDSETGELYAGSNMSVGEVTIDDFVQDTPTSNACVPDIPYAPYPPMSDPDVYVPDARYAVCTNTKKKQAVSFYNDLDLIYSQQQFEDAKKEGREVGVIDKGGKKITVAKKTPNSVKPCYTEYNIRAQAAKRISNMQCPPGPSSCQDGDGLGTIGIAMDMGDSETISFHSSGCSISGNSSSVDSSYRGEGPFFDSMSSCHSV
jgi:hypothetical protein